MSRYVNAWCASCEICQKTKKNHKAHPNNPIGTIDAKFPWDLISIDIWDAGCKSRSENKYVLSVIDVYSKFAFAKAIPTEDEKTVANALVDIFTTMGFPKRLHSDRGSQFTSQLLKELCELYFIEKSTTTAYHPQGNGVVERLHQFFKHAVASFVSHDNRIWDEVLRFAIPIYNDAIHEALGVSPAQIVLGRSLGSIGYQEEEHKEINFTHMQFVQRVKYALNKVQHLIADRKLKKQQSTSNDDSQNNPTIFENGSKVAMEVVKMTTNDQLSNKLKFDLKGPFTVVRRNRNNKAYYLKDEFDEELIHPVSIDRLRKWTERDVDMMIMNEKDEKVLISPVINEGENYEGPLLQINPDDNYCPDNPIDDVRPQEVQPRTLRSDKNATSSDDPLIGKRIRVLWPNGKYYYGTVKSKCTTREDRAEGTHVVKYEDDNNSYFEKLNVVKFEIVSGLLSRQNNPQA
jgi:hypothetical protein